MERQIIGLRRKKVISKTKKIYYLWMALNDLGTWDVINNMVADSYLKNSVPVIADEKENYFNSRFEDLRELF